jgi:hypothetical protein
MKSYTNDCDKICFVFINVISKSHKNMKDIPFFSIGHHQYICMQELSIIFFNNSVTRASRISVVGTQLFNQVANKMGGGLQHCRNNSKD